MKILELWCKLQWNLFPWVLLTQSPPSAAYMSVNCVSVGSGNGLSPVLLQAINWTNAGLLSIGPIGTNFSWIRIEIQNFSFRQMHLKMTSAKLAAILSRGRWVNNESSLVQIMACSNGQNAASHYLNRWCPTLLMHISVIWPQWVKYWLILPLSFRITIAAVSVM